MLSRVDTSLVQLVFHPLDDEGHPPVDRFFSEGDLPTTAELLCKLSALLLQAYWLVLKRDSRQGEVPREFEYIASQIWAGHWDFTEGMAISILRDACMAPASSSIAALIRNADVFDKWREMIQHRSIRYKRIVNILDSGDWYGRFAELLEALPILGVASYEGESFRFKDSLPVPAFPFMFKSQQLETPLFLYSFKPVDARAAILFEDPYSDYTEEVQLDDQPDLRNSFDSIRQALGLERVRRGYVCLFGNDYQNLTDLAWAISSATGDTLDGFIRRFKDETDERVSGQLEYLEDIDVVTLAIATDGPTRVLRRLLRGREHELFVKYLDYLKRRKGDKQVSKDWGAFFEKHFQRRTSNAEPFLGADGEIKRKVIENIKLDTMCWCLIKAAGLKIDAPPGYIESIGMHTKMVKKLWDKYSRKEIQKETLILDVAKIFERIHRFLICFYSGARGYYASYCRNAADFDSHEASMLAAAKDTYQNIKEATPGTLAKGFREICKSLSKSEELKVLFGRDRICREKDYNKLVEEWFAPVNPTKHDKTELFFKEKELRPIIKNINYQSVKAFVDTTLELLEFLKDGIVPGRVNSGDIAEPIYPMVVSFREEHRKRDGFSIYNYRVHLTDSLSQEQDDTGDVKILTSREHLSNEQYYCVPCRGKTTSEWWLDPFLIRCNKFHGASDDLEPEGENDAE